MDGVPLDLTLRRDLGKILDDSFRLYRAHLRTLLVAAFLIVAPVQLGIFGVGLGWLWSGYQKNPSVGELALTFGTQLVILAPLLTAMAVHVAQEAAEGRAAGPSAALRFALDRFPALLATLLIAGIGMALGLFLLVIPALILFIGFSMAAQVVAVEGLQGPAALARSWALVGGNWGWVIAVLLVSQILFGVLGAAIVLPLDLLADSADQQVIVLAGTIVGQTLIFPLTGLAAALMYFGLLARRAAQPTPAAAPTIVASTPPPAPADEPEPAPALAADPDLWARREAEGWLPPSSSS